MCRKKIAYLLLEANLILITFPEKSFGDGAFPNRDEEEEEEKEGAKGET